MTYLLSIRFISGKNVFRIHFRCCGLSLPKLIAIGI